MFDTDYSEKKFLAMKEYNFNKALQEKDAIIAEKEIEHKNALAEKDNALAAKDAEIALLKEQLAKKN